MAKKNLRTKKHFGGCAFDGTSPPVSNLSSKTPILNVWMSFEDALKLNLAIQQCVGKLNSYNRATKAGKETGLTISVQLHGRRITVHEF